MRTDVEHTLIQQVGAKGYYGKVRLAVEPVDTLGVAIDFDETCGSDWRIGTQFGVVYGWELHRRTQPVMNGLNVRVLEITGKPADTTNLVMAFVATQALWKALGWTPPKPPAFDPKSGRFTFPKY